MLLLGSPANESLMQHIKYRIAGYFRMVQIFVFFVREPCIRKLNVRKFEDCTTCYVRVRERTKIKRTNFSKNLVCTKIRTYENIPLYGIMLQSSYYLESTRCMYG